MPGGEVGPINVDRPLPLPGKPALQTRRQRTLPATPAKPSTHSPTVAGSGTATANDRLFIVGQTHYCPVK